MSGKNTIGDGNPGVSKFNAVTVNSIENEKVFEGIVFSVSKRFSIPSSSTSGGIVDIVFDPTSCTCGFLVFEPLFLKAFGAGPVNIDIYYDVDSDNDGTLWESENRDQTSDNTTDVIIRLNPTINDTALELEAKKSPLEDVIYSDGVPAVAQLGGEVQSEEITNVKLDRKFLIRLTNTENVAAVGHMAGTWFKVE